MSVYDKARELVDALQQEEVYTEFIQYQREVYQDPQHKEMLLSLRNKEFAVNRQQLLGKEVGEDEKEELRRLYEVARHNPVVGGYMDAEYKFSRMMMDIQKIINDAVPVQRPSR